MSDFNENDTQVTPEEINSSEQSASSTDNTENSSIMNGSVPNYGTGPEIVSGTEKGRKKHVGLIAGIAAIVVLAGGSAAAYNFIPAVKNTVKMATLDDTEYYQWVESENADESIKSITESYGMIDEQQASSAEIGLKLDLNSEAVMTLLEQEAGATLSDSGFKLPGSIAANMTGKIEGQEAAYTYSIDADGASIATMNAYIKDNKIYYQIPEISSDYIAMDLNEMLDSLDLSDIRGLSINTADLTGNGSSIKDVISEDELETLLTTYSDVIFSNIEDVELTKGVEEEVNGSQQKYNVLEADIDEGTIYTIASEALKIAENDKLVSELASELGICGEEEYKSTVSELKDQMSKYEIRGGDVLCKMSVYVDSNGKICGRSFSDPSDTPVLSYLCAKDGDDMGIEASLVIDGESFTVSGDLENKSDKLNGSVDVAFNSSSESDSFKATVNLSDLEPAGDNDQYLNGTIGLDLSSMGAGTYSANFTSDGNSQNISTDITVDGTNYGKLSLSLSENTTKEVPAFDSGAKVYNYTEDGAELEQYMNSADITGFMNKIGDAFGISGLGDLIYGGYNGTNQNAPGGTAIIGGADPSIYDDLDDLDNDFNDLDDLDDQDDNDYLTDDVNYDLKSVKCQLNGTDVTFPSKINGIFDYVKANDTQLDAGAMNFYSSDDYSVSITVQNNGTAPAAPADCSIMGVSVYDDSSQLKLSIDGFTIGSNMKDVASKYGMKMTNEEEGYLTVYDSNGTYNYITFTFDDGKVDSMSIYMYQ